MFVQVYVEQLDHNSFTFASVYSKVYAGVLTLVYYMERSLIQFSFIWISLLTMDIVTKQL